MPTPVMLPMSCVVLKHHYSVIPAFALSGLMPVRLLDLFYLTSARRANTQPKGRRGEERQLSRHQMCAARLRAAPGRPGTRAPRQSSGTAAAGHARCRGSPGCGAGRGCRAAPGMGSPRVPSLSHAEALGKTPHWPNLFTSIRFWRCSLFFLRRA